MVENSPGDVRATERLMKYWTHGEGAIKIDWGVPGDFDRCVALLTKYFPKDPKGLCANLHHRAIGVWPGQEDGGRGHHAIAAAIGELENIALTASASAALDTTQPMAWMAPLAPYDSWTSEPGGRRKFQKGSLTHRDLPMPLYWKTRTGGTGHADSVVVGRITNVDLSGDYPVASGELFTSDVVPEVGTMAHLARGGVLGLSIDPGGPVEGEMETEFDADGGGTPGVIFTGYHMGGATAVAMPAFAGQRLLIWNSNDAAIGNHLDDWDPEEAGDEETYGLIASGWTPEKHAEFTVLGTGWENMSVAQRDAKWSADHAIQRIFSWANGDPKRLSEIYLWRDPQGNPGDTSSYRLPIADIINDQPVIFYSAVYHAAALLQGGHGGLPTITEVERAQLKQIITRIYAKISDALGVKIQAPWNRPPTRKMKTRLEADDMTDDGLTAAVNSSGWSSLPMADADTVWRAGQAIKQLKAYAGVDGDSPNWQKYGNGFLWHANTPNEQGDFKLPICYVTDGKLTIVPRAVNAVASRLSGTDIPEADKARIQEIVNMLQKRFGGGGDDGKQMALLAGGAPIAPPRQWFENPQLSNKTKITVSEDGRVFGHLADWTTCHLGIQGKCVMAPHSHNDYADFHVGTVVTQEGDVLDAGNLTANTGHAALSLTAGATKEHYDHTGTQVAVVRAGEDEFGIWVAGSLTPDVDVASTAALMRRSPLSGDWRPVDGKLSLVAALHVNRPGFQIKPRFAMDDEGELTALVAAGVLHENLDETQLIQLENGGVVSHTPQMSTPVDDAEVDAQVARANRFDLLLNGIPSRAERIKNVLGG